MSKWLKGLQEPIRGSKGEEIKPDGKNSIKIGEMINGAVFVAKSKDAKEAIRKQLKIMPMLNAAKNAIELEDNDYEIVKKAVEQNPEQRPDGIWGQMLLLFEDNKK